MRVTKELPGWVEWVSHRAGNRRQSAGHSVARRGPPAGQREDPWLADPPGASGCQDPAGRLAYLPRLSNAIASAATRSRELGRRDDRIRRDARPMVLARRDVAPATKRSPVGARGVLGRLRGVSQRGWAWSRVQAVTRSRGAQAGAGGDDRRRSVMHGVNDLRVVNPLQINARDAEMGMLDMRVIWQLCHGSRCGLRR